MAIDNPAASRLARLVALLPTVIALLPKAAAWPAFRMPALTRVPPV